MHAKTKPPGFDSGGSHLRVGVLAHLLTGKGRPGGVFGHGSNESYIEYI